MVLMHRKQLDEAAAIELLGLMLQGVSAMNSRRAYSHSNTEAQAVGIHPRPRSEAELAADCVLDRCCSIQSEFHLPGLPGVHGRVRHFVDPKGGAGNREAVRDGGRDMTARSNKPAVANPAI